MWTYKILVVCLFYFDTSFHVNTTSSVSTFMASMDLQVLSKAKRHYILVIVHHAHQRLLILSRYDQLLFLISDQICTTQCMCISVYTQAHTRTHAHPHAHTPTQHVAYDTIKIMLETSALPTILISVRYVNCITTVTWHILEETLLHIHLTF